jgi:hypothetical protein
MRDEVEPRLSAHRRTPVVRGRPVVLRVARGPRGERDSVVVMARCGGRGRAMSAGMISAPRSRPGILSAVTPEDTTSPPESRQHQGLPVADAGRRVRALAGATLLIIVVAAIVVAGFYTAVDRLHPHDRIVSSGRVWHCALVGGSWPVDAGPLVGLDPDLSIVRIGAVDGAGGWIAVARIQGPARGTVEASFVLGDSAGKRLGALDQAARAIARVQSPLLESHHRGAIAAARECLRRNLPEIDRRLP